MAVWSITATTKKSSKKKQNEKNGVCYYFLSFFSRKTPINTKCEMEKIKRFGMEAEEE
jgi:guanylate kinase